MEHARKKNKSKVKSWIFFFYSLMRKEDDTLVIKEVVTNEKNVTLF